MISDQVPKLIRDQFDRPSNVHEKMGPKFALSKTTFGAVLAASVITGNILLYKYSQIIFHKCSILPRKFLQDLLTICSTLHAV